MMKWVEHDTYSRLFGAQGQLLATVTECDDTWTVRLVGSSFSTGARYIDRESAKTAAVPALEARREQVRAMPPARSATPFLAFASGFVFGTVVTFLLMSFMGVFA